MPAHTMLTDTPPSAPEAQTPTGRHTTPTRRWLLGWYDYPVHHRVFEIAVVATFVGLAATFARRVVMGVTAGWTWWRLVALTVASVVAYAVSDLLSGLVHFAFDNLGSPDTPLIGQKFVKPFRDHHSDPQAMTHGDLIAVNGDNVFASLLLLVPSWLLLDAERHPYAATFVLALLGGVIATNQIHKWCHTPTVPAFVAFAQRHGLILSPEHHDVHHHPPFASHYCITWGRVDLVVDAVARRSHRHRAQGRVRRDTGS
jgi:ubiquitin-conjugating enzyme E2 variant